MPVVMQRAAHSIVCSSLPVLGSCIGPSQPTLRITDEQVRMLREGLLFYQASRAGQRR